MTIDGFPDPRGKPSVVERGRVAVPEEFDDEKHARDWCESVNYLYGNGIYTTTVTADSYLLGTRGDHLKFRPLFLKDDDGQPEEHPISGRLTKVELAPPLGSWVVEQSLAKGLRYQPFAYLEEANDVFTGEVTGPGQIARVPIAGQTVLIFQRAA